MLCIAVPRAPQADVDIVHAVKEQASRTWKYLVS